MVAFKDKREWANALLREPPDDTNEKDEDEAATQLDGGQGQVDLTSPQQAPWQQQALVAAEKPKAAACPPRRQWKILPRRSSGSSTASTMRCCFRIAVEVGSRWITGCR